MPRKPLRGPRSERYLYCSYLGLAVFLSTYLPRVAAFGLSLSEIVEPRTVYAAGLFPETLVPRTALIALIIMGFTVYALIDRNVYHDIPAYIVISLASRNAYPLLAWAGSLADYTIAYIIALDLSSENCLTPATEKLINGVVDGFPVPRSRCKEGEEETKASTDREDLPRGTDRATEPILAAGDPATTPSITSSS